MEISILTLFPEMFAGPFEYSIIKRAKEKGLVSITLTNIRDFASDAYKSVDDHPYGGGVGMVMRVDVIDRALHHAKEQQHTSVIPAQAGISFSQKLDPRFGSTSSPSRAESRDRGDDTHTVLLDPRGTTFTQTKARELAKLDHLILISGHYEGVDERVRELVDESISIGDYVLTGGELPAMVMTDAIVRLLPDVLKNEATSSESFSLEIGNWKLDIPLLEYPQYTRPPEYNGMKVPAILLSGDHKKITAWKKDHTTARKDRASRRKATAKATRISPGKYQDTAVSSER